MNHKARLSAYSLRLFDVIAGSRVDRGIRCLHLPPGGSRRFSYPLRFAQRGRHRLEAVTLQTRFPFGLFLKTITLPITSEVVVYPAHSLARSPAA